jgi:Protein of unknown function (DUF3467)
MSQPNPLPQRATINITPEIEVGVYANFVGVWHQPDCFVLDFSTHTQPPKVVQDESGQKFIDLSTRVVSRVRIPPGQVFEIMKALEQQLSAWERETGGVRPEPPQE